jgi:dTDP-glucose 4,6-dehydratase
MNLPLSRMTRRPEEQPRLAVAPRIAIDDLEHVLLETTKPLPGLPSARSWEELRGEQIFITGGTGFYGCWLMETFCHINRSLGLHARATVLTRDPAAFAARAPHLCADPGLTILRGDVRDFVFPTGTFRFVIHAATDVAREASVDPRDMLSTLVSGTQRALEFAVSHGAKRFLLTSSGAVYGRQPADIVHLPESYPGAPDPLDFRSLYAEGKRTAEQLCAIFSNNHGLDCAIARCWSFRGAHLALDKHFAIGNFIGDALAGRLIHIKGDGHAWRSYLYGSDLAIWLWTMLFNAPSLLPINVGSADEVSIFELAETVSSVLNASGGIQVDRAFDPAGAVSRYVPSVDRAWQTMGLRQTVTLSETIRRTASWHQQRASPSLL